MLHRPGDPGAASGRGKRCPLPTEAQRWEKAFVVLTLFTFCRGFDLVFGALYGGVGIDARGLDESNPARFVWLLMLDLTALVLLFRHHGHQLLDVIGQNKLLTLLTVFVLVSSIWSVEPEVTLRRAVAYALTTTFCVYLALRFRPLEILTLAAWVLVAVAVFSLVMVVVAPDIGVPEATRKVGSWAGIATITTFFGRLMALAALTVWCLRREEWGLQRYDVLVFLFVLFCLWMSQAMTAIVSAGCALASVPFLWAARSSMMPPRARLVLFALLAAPALLFLAAYFSDLMIFLGRDPTLTNRTFIWRAAYELGLQRPILGAGFRSFWVESNASSVFYNMFGSAGTLLGNGHNGYLDMWLELGLIGLALLGVLLVQALARVTRYIDVVGDGFGTFYGVLIVFILIYSTAEKVILEHSEITWVLFITGFVATKWRSSLVEQVPETMPAASSLEPVLPRRRLTSTRD